MSLGKSLAKLLVYAVLNFGALAGVPMDPEKIRELMQVMNRTKIVQVLKKDDPPQ